MQELGYNSVTSCQQKETIFIEWKGSPWIIHGLFVDDMAHTSTSTEMLDILFQNIMELSSNILEETL